MTGRNQTQVLHKPPVTTQDKVCRAPTSQHSQLYNPKDGFPPLGPGGVAEAAFGFSLKWPCCPWFPNPAPQESGLSAGPDILASPSIRKADRWCPPGLQRRKGRAWPPQLVCRGSSRGLQSPGHHQLPLLPGDARFGADARGLQRVQKVLGSGFGLGLGQLLDGCLQGPARGCIPGEGAKAKVNTWTQAGGGQGASAKSRLSRKTTSNCIPARQR